MSRFMTPEQRQAMHRVLKEVEFERMDQHLKRGEQDHPSFPETAVNDPDIARQMADEARDECDKAFKQGKGSYCHILMEEFAEACAECLDEDALRAELIQVAAVAVAWVETIDRRKKNAEAT